MSEKREPSFEAPSANTDTRVEGRSPGENDENAAPRSPEGELAAANARAAENLDKLLRARAEMENVRRRAELDVANTHKYAIERFAGELLAVRDSLDLARTVDIKQENQTALAKMHEGLDLTLKLLDDVFRK